MKFLSFAQKKKKGSCCHRIPSNIFSCQGFDSPPDDVIPFDAASEVPLEEQRAEAMTRIQDSLLTGQAPEALSLLRSAR